MRRNEVSNLQVDASGDIDFELSIEEQINQMNLDMLNRANRFIKNIKRGINPTTEEIEEQKQINKQIQIIEQAYNRLLKRKQMNRTSDNDFAELLKKVKEQKSSVGDIVRKID